MKYYEEPLVSVLMNCYNGSRYIKNAIESVILQSYKNWELVIWDNQSTDNSLDIINLYKKKDKRIKCFVSKNHTDLGGGRASAWKHLKGKYLAILDTDDLFKSDRVLIGGESTKSGERAINLLFNIYNQWIPKEKILTTNVWSSELSKLVSNAMLAQRISSINSISALCEETGADIEEVAKAVGMDTRIGNKFLKSSIGFGGSCFKKDILNLVYISRFYGLNEVADYWESVVKINNYQTNRIGDKIIKALDSEKNNNVVAILGWAFKKDTNDSRESASIYLAKQLLDNNIKINIYDPKVSKSRIINDLALLFKSDNKNDSEVNNLLSKVSIVLDPYDAFINVSAISLCTEWDSFVKLDWNKIYSIMNQPSFIFDGRGILNKSDLSKIGFQTYSIGKS